MAFWNNANGATPKQAHRWIIYLDNDKTSPIYFKAVDKPSFAIKNIKAKYLYSHEFNFPGRVTWQPITLVLNDMVVYGDKKDFGIDWKLGGEKPVAGTTQKINNSTQSFIYGLLNKAGYYGPNEDVQTTYAENVYLRSFNFKKDLVGALIGQGNKYLEIQELDNEIGAIPGGNKVEIKPYGVEGEKWRLYNPLIADVKFEKLDYSADTVLSITLTLSYDWAELRGPEGSKVTNRPSSPVIQPPAPPKAETKVDTPKVQTQNQASLTPPAGPPVTNTSPAGQQPAPEQPAAATPSEPLPAVEVTPVGETSTEAVAPLAATPPTTEAVPVGQAGSSELTASPPGSGVEYQKALEQAAANASVQDGKVYLPQADLQAVMDTFKNITGKDTTQELALGAILTKKLAESPIEDDIFAGPRGDAPSAPVVDVGNLFPPRSGEAVILKERELDAPILPSVDTSEVGTQSAPSPLLSTNTAIDATSSERAQRYLLSSDATLEQKTAVAGALAARGISLNLAGTGLDTPENLKAMSELAGIVRTNSAAAAAVAAEFEGRLSTESRGLLAAPLAQPEVVQPQDTVLAPKVDPLLADDMPMTRDSVTTLIKTFNKGGFFQNPQYLSEQQVKMLSRDDKEYYDALVKRVTSLKENTSTIMDMPKTAAEEPFRKLNEFVTSYKPEIKEADNAEQLFNTAKNYKPPETTWYNPTTWFNSESPPTVEMFQKGVVEDKTYYYITVQQSAAASLNTKNKTEDLYATQELLKYSQNISPAPLKGDISGFTTGDVVRQSGRVTYRIPKAQVTVR